MVEEPITFGSIHFEVANDDLVKSAGEMIEAQIEHAYMTNRSRELMHSLYKHRKKRRWRGEASEEEKAVAKELSGLQEKMETHTRVVTEKRDSHAELMAARRPQRAASPQDEDQFERVARNNRALEEEHARVQEEIAKQHAEIAALGEQEPEEVHVRRMAAHEIEPLKDPDVPLHEIGGVDPATVRKPSTPKPRAKKTSKKK